MPLILALAAAAAVLPGRYESLMVAVSPDGRVVARLFEERGTGPHFSCEVLFAGRPGPDGKVVGVSWAGGERPRRAMLSAQGADVTLSAPGSSGYPGCGMTMGAELDDPLDLSRTAPARWTALLRILPRRAALRPSPGAPAPTRPYVVADDVVGLISRRPGWVEVGLVSDAGRRMTGWLPEAEVRPIAPPR